jgi:pimeloyl-ACP methyl ester carboxylesterase
MKNFHKLIVGIAVLSILMFSAHAQDSVVYPYPIQKIRLNIEHKMVKMAYMDVIPLRPIGKTVLLFHGKNFNGYYWKSVIEFLSQAGFRVVIPDQVGWGQSDRSDIHYSFYLLASNTKILLDSLHIDRAILIGHSMGGMLATRFSIMFPEIVEKLILEDPIGLEDYKRFIPYQSLETQYAKELSASYASYKKYQESYYPVWKPEYEQYVKAEAIDLKRKDFKEIAWSNALSYQMIYEQPVCYEWDRITVSTLLIVGQVDSTVVGKELLQDTEKNQHGHYPELGRRTHLLLPNSVLVELPGVGHIPHVQEFTVFKEKVLDFLR